MNTSMNTRSELKKSQLTILRLLYRFRFLNRSQIQIILNHKSHYRILTWLNNLVEQKYINKDFTRKFGALPSIYWLATKASKALAKSTDLTTHDLKIIYKEKNRSVSFRDNCLLVADIFISLTKLTQTVGSKLHFYTRTELWGTKGMILPVPDIYFAIEEPDGRIKRYFLDIFSTNDPRMWYRKRIKQYLEYYDEGYWQKSTDRSFPEIILVCGDEVMKRYAEKNIKKLLDDEGSDLQFYLTTILKIQILGLNQESISKVKVDK